jgi:SAM-dependent methyltransferase
MEPASLENQLRKMEADWDQRARENARHYVATGQREWSDEDFLLSGRRTVEEEILPDLNNICQGRDPKGMRVLEIGCGTGRVTRALAEVFGEVHGVDVSGEMIAIARQSWADQPSVRLYKNNGMDLSVLPDIEFDFAFSSIVFQHIPSKAIIENYVREVHRRLRPGGLFKFQVQGGPVADSSPDSTWLGVTISEQESIQMALRCGFDPVYRHGAGEQYFWLWYCRRG